jgi:HAMP domain
MRVNIGGKVYKVVKFATDITAQKTAQAELERCMSEAQQCLGAMAQGDLTQPMTGSYQGTLDRIKVSINAALANLTGFSPPCVRRSRPSRAAPRRFPKAMKICRSGPASRLPRLKKPRPLWKK